jgi:hypothetical protein
MLEKTKDNCVILTFASCFTCTCSFDLWMFCACFDTFDTVVSFINASWELYHVTIGNFEIDNIVGVAMANYVKTLLDSFSLRNKIIAYIKK